MVLPLLTKVNMHFIGISSLSDHGNGVKDEEPSSEQNVSIEEVSQVRTLKESPFPQKAYPCEICVSALKDILPFSKDRETHPRQTPYTYGACGKQLFNIDLSNYITAQRNPSEGVWVGSYL